jgi:hypothetical protein
MARRKISSLKKTVGKQVLQDNGFNSIAPAPVKESSVPIDTLRFPADSLRPSVSFHSALLSISDYSTTSSGFNLAAYTA